MLGISPDRPETGFGYIKTAGAPVPTLVVERFVEKPDAATAQSYRDEGAITGMQVCLCSGLPFG